MKRQSAEMKAQKPAFKSHSTFMKEKKISSGRNVDLVEVIKERLRRSRQSMSDMRKNQVRFADRRAQSRSTALIVQ